MIENIEHRQLKIEKLKFKGKTKGIIFDALFICDIENDKIQPDLKMELNRIVEDLVPGEMPQSQAETQPITDKLSITKETIEILHACVMKAIKDNLNLLGITDAEKIDSLNNVVFNIIQHEKSHRDEERRLM